ncbi:MAG: transporter [Halobacteriaceae archaeon]
MSTSDTPRPDAATAVRGAAAGVAAYVVGYLLAYLTATDAARRAVRAFEPFAQAGGRFAPDWKVAGWAFYDAHLVGTRFADRTVDLVAFASVQYLYLVPVLLLVLAGAAVAYAAGARTPREGVAAGITVAAGYVLLALFGAFVLQYANVRPSPLRAVVVAGVVYPVAFGALGGALAAVARGGE